MSVSEPVTMEEAMIWSDMVATHFAITGRDLDDAESRLLIQLARTLAAEALSLAGDEMKR